MCLPSPPHPVGFEQVVGQAGAAFWFGEGGLSYLVILRWEVPAMGRHPKAQSTPPGLVNRCLARGIICFRAKHRNIWAPKLNAVQWVTPKPGWWVLSKSQEHLWVSGIAVPCHSEGANGLASRAKMGAGLGSFRAITSHQSF